MLPGVFTAMVVVQDGGSQLSYYISTGRASSIHSQLAKAPGGLAWDYLRGDEYSSLKVEWAAFDRNVLATRNAPFSSLESLILTNCNKSTISYTFVGTIEPTLRKQIYTEADLNAICDSIFKNTSSNGVAIVHIIFLHGEFTDPAAVGISFTADRFALFGDTLSDTYLRVSVAHEMGHLLGLVAPLGLNSRYTPTNASQHYDSADPPHCTSNPCLMRPVVSSYDQPCRFCVADMREIKNTTAPYTLSGTAPEFRAGLILVGASATAVIAVAASVLYRPKKYS